MTYRERRLRKADRLREWAEKRQHRSEAAFQTAHTIADGIPLGQPILVGHHSEKRHRRAVERIDNGMRKGFEHLNKAQDMRSRADGIEHAAEGAIYSDDTDALDQMRERIAELEAKRARMKAINAEIRKGAGWADRLTLTDEEKRDLEMAARFSGCIGYPAYALSNLSGNIARNRKRLPELEARAVQRARVAAVLAAEREAES